MDVFRIVRLPDPKRPVVLRDISDRTTYDVWRDPPLSITAPPEQAIRAQIERRYGGSRQVGATHENGSVSRKLRIRGATAEACLNALEALIAETEDHVGKYVEWRAENAPRSTYFELRGVATRELAYSWVQFVQGIGLDLTLVFPVAPLVRYAAMDIWDDFAVDSLADYSFDGQAGTVQVTGGQLAPITTAAPKRLYHSARGYRYADVQVTAKHTLGAVTGPASYEFGLSAKRLDANNHLFAYVSGTVASIYKRDGGTNTSLGSITVPALAAGASYWLRLRTEGNVVFVEHWTTEPTPLGSPANTGSIVLSGADAVKFGAGVRGDCGIGWWTPGDTSARVDDLRIEPYTYRNRTLPEALRLLQVPGTAPALADIAVTPSGGSSPPIFGMIAWSKRPSADANAPFGIIEAETGGDLTGWAPAADANYRGGSGLKVTTSGAGAAAATYLLDPSVLPADPFSAEEYDVDVFLRHELHAGVVSPKLVLSTEPEQGSNFGAVRYASPHEAAGKLLVVPTGGAAVRRFSKIGSLRLDRAGGRVKLRLAGSWAAGSSGVFGLDHLTLVLAARVALSPTGKANDGATYPRFIRSTAQTTKTITHALRGWTASPPNAFARDNGLGGSPIEFPAPGPGAGSIDVDLLVKLSTLVPDDPTASAATEQLGHSATVHAAVIPRGYMARGA